jgi:hypothetical protein
MEWPVIHKDAFTSETLDELPVDSYEIIILKEKSHPVKSC